MKDLIVLIGMMGCGKTTIGALLTKKIGYNFIDIDDAIEKEENSSITNIFNEHGEQYFRRIEKEKILEFVDCKKTVLSLGGGAFENKETRNILMNAGTIIYLKADAKCLFERIKNETHRPLLRENFSLEKIDLIMNKRVLNYEKAHFTIDSCENSPDEIVNMIWRIIK